MKTKKCIGFIAMSGVRAHNAELTALGLTLPGFVERNKQIASLPSLGLLTLAGLTPPERFDIEYHEIADLKRVPISDSKATPHPSCGHPLPVRRGEGRGEGTLSKLDLPDHFDLVAISTFTAQFYEACEVADHYRALGVPVVMGGITVSSLVEQSLEHCTSVVIGEGEPLWPQVLRDLEENKLQRIYASSPAGKFDLRDAPLPRFDLLDPEKYNRITVQTSRGCPHRCEFCASSILLTPHYKVKPVEKVIAEIRAIKAIWPRPFIEFADDNSFIHRAHYKRLLRELAKENLRWFTETDVRVAEDDELLGLMRDAGCQQILIGLESPRRTSLDGLELKNNWKARQPEHYQAAIAKIQSYGITVNGCFIVGLDHDTPEIFADVLHFVRDSGLFEVQVTFSTAFPGTPFYQRLKAEGRILRDQAWELCTLFDINIRPASMSVAELQAGFLGLVKQLYSDTETQTRRRRFRRMLRTSPNFGRNSQPNEQLLAA